MRLLVLGGTQFLSREVAAQATRRGHEVVCANRGLSGALPPGTAAVRWDREEPAPPELAAAGPYDAVVDVARRPTHVRHALDAVPDAHWVFVSTISVYADDSDPAGPGAGRLHEPTGEEYGPLKVACEELVRDRAASATVVRPGLVVGPGDPSGRFAYWSRRAGETGALLGPGDPGSLVQVIDVRDLAGWILTLAEQRPEATLDAVGPRLPMAELVAAVAPAAAVTWVPDDFLAAQGVEPWAGPDSIPVWLPRPQYDGMLAHDARPALDAGLTVRSLAETVHDTRAWLDADPAARIDGITREREAALLATWSAT